MKVEKDDVLCHELISSSQEHGIMRCTWESARAAATTAWLLLGDLLRVKRWAGWVLQTSRTNPSLPPPPPPFPGPLLNSIGSATGPSLRRPRGSRDTEHHNTLMHPT